MKIHCIATVKETNQTWADEDDFQVLKPTISVKVHIDWIFIWLCRPSNVYSTSAFQFEEEPLVGRESIVSLSFKNPLRRTLTQCQFNCAGPGLSRNQTIEFRDIAPEEEVRVEHSVVAQRPGPQRIIATFTSKELTDITGSASIDVLEEGN